jgi:hypothetical protein
MSFASSAARGSAIPTPTLGMYTHLEDAPARTEFWNGSAWVSPFGMTLIKTITVSGASSANFGTNTFSTEFDDYKILMDFSGSTLATLNLRFMSGGFPNSTGAYQQIGIGYTTNNTSANTGFGALNQTSTRLFTLNQGAGPSASEMTIYNPRLSRVTVTNGIATALNDNVTFLALINHAGIFNATTVFDDVQFFPSAGTITGRMSIYGMRK